MTQSDIDRINQFVGLQSPKSNKSLIKILLVLLVLPVMGAYGNSIMLNYDFFTSKWIIFIAINCFLVLWGIYLIATLEKHQINIFLFEGIWGLCFVVELFILGYFIGRHINHFAPVILILLILLDLPILLLLTAYRIKLFRGHDKKNIRRRFFLPSSIMFAILFFTAPLFNHVLDGTRKEFQYGMSTLCLFLLGYIFSMYIVLGGNYFVALKYKDIIRFYKNETIKAR